MWSSYLYDSITGQLAAQIDLPSFTWSMTVNDASFSTTRTRKPEEDSLSGLNIPWSQIPGNSPETRAAALMCGKRGLALFWKTSLDDPDKPGTPVLAGILGVRRSTSRDVTIPFDSIHAFLQNRYLVHEGRFGAGKDHTSPDSWKMQNLSLRAIACEIIRQCTESKPGGRLPIDLPYLGESGKNNRADWADWNIGNQRCDQLLDGLAALSGGPDMQFRPYLTADGNGIRFRFIAGSDADPNLGQSIIHSLSYHPLGGTLENLEIARMLPVQRVYGTGSGSDKATITALAEDLTLNRTSDPWPLVESSYGDTDAKDLNQLESSTRARLEANKRPLMQMSGEIDVRDVDASGTPLHPLGSFWPGELFDVSVDGYPDLPDGVYRQRLMQMSGDETGKVKLLFDICEDPVY